MKDISYLEWLKREPARKRVFKFLDLHRYVALSDPNILNRLCYLFPYCRRDKLERYLKEWLEKAEGDNEPKRIDPRPAAPARGVETKPQKPRRARPA